MMWLVRLALRRPISVVVMALLMLVLGTLSFFLMNIDIFPAINVPVVMVVWSYPGMASLDMERRMVFISERAYTTTVNGIEHIESESMLGVGLLKVYFQPGADIASAIAQINAVSEAILTNMARGTEPPQIISYNAADVPVAQINVSSDTKSSSQLFDYAFNFMRLQLFTIPGFSSPAPLGGVTRAVMVNIDPTELYANNVSPNDLGSSLATSNVIIPSGTARMGHFEYNVDINMSPNRVADFNRLPVKIVNGAPVLLGDVASVTDTHQPQTNVVRVDGKPATYLMVIRHAAASTLAVVDAVKERLPFIRATAPEGIKIALTFDQSAFVREALVEVVREAVIAAILVALMVLVFVGSARSMLIVITSIPLAILTAIVGLKLSGETINTMTLGGIALAIGMLVDDATVEVENIHRNHAMRKPLLVAILDGAHQIATPTLVGTLSICIVFFPVVLLSGVARFLFTPLALAVVYAMLTSYLLSRTLVPTMASYLLPQQHTEPDPNSLVGRFLHGFEAGFERLRAGYTAALEVFVVHRTIGLVAVGLVIVGSLPLLSIVGEDFFPSVDAGMMRLHVRAPTGTRIERTEQIVGAVEQSIRKIIPPDELESISDNIGVPTSYDLAYYQTDSVAGQDADVLIQLKPKHRPTAMYEDRIRQMLPVNFPQVEGYFQAADIVSQVLNFGLPAADRRADLRLQPELRLCNRSETEEQGEPHSGSGRHQNRRAARLSCVQGQRRSHQSARSWRNRTASRVESARRALRRHSASAEFLAQSGKRRQLQRDRAGAVSFDEFGRCDREHAAHAGRGEQSAKFRAATLQRRIDHARHRSRGRRSLLRAARDRPGLRSVGPRPRQRDQRGAARDRFARKTADRNPHQHPRPEPGDAQLVPDPRRRHRARDRPRLPADGRKFSVMAGAFHHHDGNSGRAGRRALDAGADTARRSTSSP